MNRDDDRILLLGGPSATLADYAKDEPGLEVVADLDRCLARLADQPTVRLVIVDPSWTTPLSAAREIRHTDAYVGLAVAVGSDEAETVRSKLAFLPDATHVAVVAVDTDQVGLRRQLEEVATSTWRRQRVRGALDGINRELAGGVPVGRASTSTTSVSEHYLAALVRHAADTIVSIDPAGRIVTINDAGRRTLDLEPIEAEGRVFGDLLAPDDPGRLSAMLTDAFGGRPQARDELVVRLAGGRRLLLSATAAPVLDDAGALAGLVLIARDVTTERETEQRLRALQKAESLATLARGVAHDFNNLLVQAQGWADIARGTPDDTELVTTALDHVLEATRGASELARAMLAYGGRGSFETERLRVRRLVGDLRPLLEAVVPAKVRLELDIDGPGVDAADAADATDATDAEGSEGSEVHVDSTQLRQVILNLVTNAAEAIGDREGTIRIRTDEIAVASTDLGTPAGLGIGTYAVIEVADTGPGIAPEVQDRLFDPFFSTKFTGRGLGLAASQGIARAHGGVISVDSRPGEGACFRIHLPTIT